MSDNLLVTFHKLNTQVLSLSPASPKPNINFNLIEFLKNLNNGIMKVLNILIQMIVFVDC